MILSTSFGVGLGVGLDVGIDVRISSGASIGSSTGEDLDWSIDVTLSVGRYKYKKHNGSLSSLLNRHVLISVYISSPFILHWLVVSLNVLLANKSSSNL